MREIKFRAWHYDAVEMLYEDSPGDVFRWKNEGQPIVIEQFTGLLDKNGKEIYEGDIVRIKSEDPTSDLNGIYTIFWFYGQFVFDANRDRDFDYINFGWWVKSNCMCRNLKQVEIIGNIHENPNLLKEKK